MRDALEGREAESYDELEDSEMQEINSLMRQARCSAQSCVDKFDSLQTDSLLYINLAKQVLSIEKEDPHVGSATWSPYGILVAPSFQWSSYACLPRP